MMQARILGAALLLGLMTSHGNAALIELDLFEEGDGLITYDSKTGLEWLDLSVTKNQSYNQAAANETLRELGFRHGNTIEVKTLFQNGNILEGPSVEEAGIFIGLVSETADALGDTGIISFANGIHERTPADDLYISFAGIGIIDQGAGPSAQTIFTVNDAESSLKSSEPQFSGNWLVRQVPEPGTVGLLAIGLIGTALSRRRAAIGV